MHVDISRCSAALLFFAASCLFAADEPTWMCRYTPDVKAQPDDLTANAKSASYKPFFGIGDVEKWRTGASDAKFPRGIARYGELTVEPGGTSAIVSYPAEEQIYFVLDGNGTLLYEDQKAPIKKNDFMYLPIGARHGVANSSSGPVRVLVMGFRIPDPAKVPPTPKLMLANADDVKQQLVGGHGETSHFRLLMGTTQSKRDRLPAAQEMVSLFIMDFDPQGTNNGHSHEAEEEIYYVLRGHGDMIAGDGGTGDEGIHSTKTGEAWFFRLNCTVGYYSRSLADEPPDMILAVRSRYPRGRN